MPRRLRQRRHFRYTDRAAVSTPLHHIVSWEHNHGTPALASLWLPILVSGVALFFASWAAWMLLPHHKPRMDGPAERRRRHERRCAAINVPPGQYMFPYAAIPEECKSEEFKRRDAGRPERHAHDLEARPTWASTCSARCCSSLIANFVIAYLAGMVLPPGDDRS